MKRNIIVIIGLMLACFHNLAISAEVADKLISDPQGLSIDDNPDDVLKPGVAKLRWTAPGDDGNIGRASRYEMRYRGSNDGPIDSQADWNASTSVPIMPVPSVAGHRDSVIVRDLTPNSLYYFCIRAYDEAGNISPLSNSPMIYIPEPGTPGITGDIDNSGTLDGHDLIALVEMLKKHIYVNSGNINADFNGSGHIDGLDVVYLRAHLAGKKTPKSDTLSPPAILISNAGVSGNSIR